MHHWKAILLWGLGAQVVFFIGCFVYGLFNRFVFIHAAAPAGIDSGLAYAGLVGVMASPFVIVGGALVGAARVWWRRRLQKKSSN